MPRRQDLLSRLSVYLMLRNMLNVVSFLTFNFDFDFFNAFFCFQGAFYFQPIIGKPSGSKVRGCCSCPYTGFSTPVNLSNYQMFWVQCR